MRSLGHFSSFGIACLSFSFLSLEVSFGSLRERERETVDNFPEITRNRKKKRNESWLPSDPRNLSVRRLSLSSHHHSFPCPKRRMMEREKNPNKEMNSEDLPAITNDFLFHHLLPSLLFPVLFSCPI